MQLLNRSKIKALDKAKTKVFSLWSAIALGLFAGLILSLFIGCSNPSESQATPEPLVNTKYIADTNTVLSCWYSNLNKDSLTIGNKKYVISTRSRFRKVPEPANFGDTGLEGAIIVNNPLLFALDTKDSLTYVFSHCK